MTVRPDVPVVLLGAGASADAGLPTSTGLTDRILDFLREGLAHDLADALNFVCAQLIAQAGADGRDHREALDVERVVAAVRMLGQRRELEIAPFVGSWHPAIDAWGSSRSAPVAPFFDRNLKDALGRQSGSRARDTVVKLIEEVVDTRDASPTYGLLAEEMVRAVQGLLVLEADQVRYLGPLVEAARAEGGLTVATLNYDRGVELAAERAGVPLHTGLDARPAFGRWPDQGLQLLKLHGSVDWMWHQPEMRPPAFPARHVVSVDPPKSAVRDPALIFGAREKLRADGPFLRLLSEFEQRLASARHLVCIGYGFGDEHVNVLIARWLQRRPDSWVTVVDPKFPDKQPLRRLDPDFRTQLLGFLQPPRRDPEAFQPRLEVIRATAAHFLAYEPLVGRQRPATVA